MANPVTQYADAGGRSLAYQVVGDGPVDLVVSPGFVSHLDLNWGVPAIARFIKRLASFSRLIVYDKAGTGLSDPPPSTPTIEDRTADLLRVIDAAGADKPALFGISEGGPTAILLAATHPERVSRLVIYGSFPKGMPSDDYLPQYQEQFEGKMHPIHGAVNWGDGSGLALMSPTIASSESLRRLAGTYERAAASPAMVRMILDAVRQIDIREVLPTIKLPTLVLHRRGDIFPVEGARDMAERIEGARLVELAGSDHAPWYEDSDSVLDEVEKFVTGHRASLEPDRSLATILFTDIVDSTRMAAESGDAEWRELLDNHDALVERTVPEFGGRAVKSLGDGHLSVFPGPAAAIRCAAELNDAVRELGIELRAGVHTGECEIRGDDIGGIAVHIGARVGARAQAGEVLVSGTVRDLTVGSNLEFSDRGEHELKGVPGTWRVFSVVDGGAPPLPAPDDARDLRPSDRFVTTVARRLPRMGRAVGRLAERSAERRYGATSSQRG